MTRQRVRQTNKNASPAIPDRRLTSDIPESLLESQNGDPQFTVVLRYMCARFSMTSIKMMCQSQLCFYTHHNPGSVLVWYQCHKNITAEREMHSVSGQTPARGSCPQSSLHAQLPARPADWKWRHQFIYNMPVTVTKKKKELQSLPRAPPLLQSLYLELTLPSSSMSSTLGMVTMMRFCDLLLPGTAAALFSSLPDGSAPLSLLPFPASPTTERKSSTDRSGGSWNRLETRHFYTSPRNDNSSSTDWSGRHWNRSDLITSMPHPGWTTVPPLTNQVETDRSETSSLLCLIQNGQQFTH